MPKAMSSIKLSLIIIAAGCCAACRQSDNVNRAEPSKNLIAAGEPSQEKKDAAVAAKDALFQQLSGKLMAAMQAGGPAAAIEVCNTEAPQIAAEVSQSQGVKIGRTALKLRNSQNAPPDWAIDLINPSLSSPTFYNLANGNAAALLPIKLQPQCLMCHGPEEQISPDIKEKLAALYPGDAAIGFNEGDLRGWFWVEVPQ